ncbi:unnamed protein product [Musa textilis]
MAKETVAVFVLCVYLASSILPSLACPYCSTPTPPPPKKTPPPPPPATTPCPPPPPKKSPTPPPPPKKSPSPPPPPPTYPTPSSPPPPPTYPTPSSPPPTPPTYPTPSSPPPPTSVPCPPPPKAPTCPIDTLKLDACVDLLGGLVHVIIGGDVTSQCCPVLQGLADLDAALCLCTTIRAKALGINILLPIALEVLVDCGKHVPSDYQCPDP